jgi:CheY-like chemotaxis protein
MPKVLIIEDDENMRDVYSEQFQGGGFAVETANDGQEGMEKMESFVPDIVLLDLLMPRVSGFDFLKNLKDRPDLKHIPIMVITNLYADAQDLLKNWGVAYFLLKVDYTPGEVVEKARMLLKK